MGYTIPTTTVQPIQIPTVSATTEGVVTPEMLSDLEAAISQDAVNIYIATPANGGDDANSGLSLAAPVATIARAEEVKAALFKQKARINIGLGTFAMPTILLISGGGEGAASSPEAWLGTAADQLGARACTTGSTTSNIIDTTVSASFRTSTTASVTAVSGTANTQSRVMTVTGLNNLTSTDVGKWFFFGLATNSGNNGFFKCASVVSPTSGTFFNAQPVVENSSLIYWQDSFYGAWLRFTINSKINCVAVASLVNNDFFTVTNTASGVATIFEYKVNGGFTPTSGRTTIDVSALADPSSTGVAVATAAQIGTTLAAAYVATSATNVVTLAPLISGALPPNLSENVANAGFTVNALGSQEYRQINNHGVQATASVTVAGTVTANDTLVINDGTNSPTTFTWVGGGATGTQVNIGVDNNASAAALVAVINSVAPTSLRVRATNTAGTAVVKLTNMIMGSVGNTASPTKTGVWTPTITTFATAAAGVGAPTTTFTVGVGVGGVIFSFTPSVGDAFVVEKPGTIIQYSGNVQVNAIGQESQLGLKNIKLQAATTTSSMALSGIKLATRATEIDINGSNGFTFQASCFVGFISNAWNNDSSNPFGTAGGSGAGALFFHSGPLVFQNFSNISGGAISASAELRFNSQGAGNPVLFGRRTTVNVLTRSQITSLASLNLDGTLFATDTAIVTVDRDSYAEPGTSIVKNSPVYGLYAGRKSYLTLAAVSGDGNVKAGFCVDRQSGAIIDFGGASTTVSGTPGDVEFGHETVANIQSYATIRTTDGNGVKGYPTSASAAQVAYLNRVDA